MNQGKKRITAIHCAYIKLILVDNSNGNIKQKSLLGGEITIIPQKGFVFAVLLLEHERLVVLAKPVQNADQCWQFR